MSTFGFPMHTFTCDISIIDALELQIIDNTAITDNGRYELGDNSQNKSTQTLYLYVS